MTTQAPLTDVTEMSRHLFSVVLTIVLLSISVGLAWWIRSDRANRAVVGERDLIEVRGTASAPQARPRSRSVWFRLRLDSSQGTAGARTLELRALSADLASVEAALASGTEPVVATVVRSELDRGERAEPASVLRLVVGGRTVIPLAVGQAVRAETAGDARLSLWIASAGIAVSLLGLALHWIGKLRG